MNCADPSVNLPNHLEFTHANDAVLIYPANTGGFELVPYRISQSSGGLGSYLNYWCSFRSMTQAFLFQKAYVHQLEEVYLDRLLQVWPMCDREELSKKK